MKELTKYKEEILFFNKTLGRNPKQSDLNKKDIYLKMLSAWESDTITSDLEKELKAFKSDLSRSATIGTAKSVGVEISNINNFLESKKVGRVSS